MKLRLILPGEDDDIDLTPLVDVIFLLVLFFMVTSSFIEESKAFQVELPRAANPQTVARESALMIGVTVDGRYFLRMGAEEPEPVKDLEAMLQKLQERQVKEKGTPVIVRCDARCEYQQYVQLVNVLKVAGVERYFQEVEVPHEQKKP